MRKNRAPIPMSIFTGFLGSGKTSIINHLLKNNKDYKVAILENEYGEIGLDQRLLNKGEETFVELSNGCVCCQIKDDLINALKTLRKEYPSINYVVIETTGVADPMPIIDSFNNVPFIKNLYNFDGTITVIDGENFDWAFENEEVNQKQIIMADVVVINKCDLLSEEEITEIEKKVKSVNEFATIHKIEDATIDIDVLLNKNHHKVERVKEILDQAKSNDHGHHHEHDHSHDHHHAKGDNKHSHLGSISLTFDGKLTSANFLNEFKTLIDDNKDFEIYRIKGVLFFEELDYPCLVQGVNKSIDMKQLPDQFQKNFSQNELVIIGKNLQKDFFDNFFKTLT